MAAVRFYVDADLLALAKAMVAVRYDVTYPGDRGDPRRSRPACPVDDPSTPDDTWIPQVARNGWVTISRDARIQRKPAELAAVRQHGLKLVVIDVRGDQSTWSELSIVVAQWPKVEQVIKSTGPSIYKATRTTFREVPLG